MPVEQINFNGLIHAALESIISNTNPNAHLLWWFAGVEQNRLDDLRRHHRGFRRRHSDFDTWPPQLNVEWDAGKPDKQKGLNRGLTVNFSQFASIKKTYSNALSHDVNKPIHYRESVFVHANRRVELPHEKSAGFEGAEAGRVELPVSSASVRRFGRQCGFRHEFPRGLPADRCMRVEQSLYAGQVNTELCFGGFITFSADRKVRLAGDHRNRKWVRSIEDIFSYLENMSKRGSLSEELALSFNAFNRQGQQPYVIRLPICYRFEFVNGDSVKSVFWPTDEAASLFKQHLALPATPVAKVLPLAWCDVRIGQDKPAVAVDLVEHMKTTPSRLLIGGHAGAGKAMLAQQVAMQAAGDKRVYLIRLADLANESQHPVETGKDYQLAEILIRCCYAKDQQQALLNDNAFKQYLNWVVLGHDGRYASFLQQNYAEHRQSAIVIIEDFGQYRLSMAMRSALKVFFNCPHLILITRSEHFLQNLAAHHKWLQQTILSVRMAGLRQGFLPNYLSTAAANDDELLSWLECNPAISDLIQLPELAMQMSILWRQGRIDNGASLLWVCDRLFDGYLAGCVFRRYQPYSPTLVAGSVFSKYLENRYAIAVVEYLAMSAVVSPRLAIDAKQAMACLPAHVQATASNRLERLGFVVFQQHSCNGPGYVFHNEVWRDYFAARGFACAIQLSVDSDKCVTPYVMKGAARQLCSGEDPVTWLSNGWDDPCVRRVLGFVRELLVRCDDAAALSVLPELPQSALLAH